ncbi:hypothetical protein LSH36_52g06000 [Paralvinella palmiformis]|uniref:S-adenosylmethionine mitochondrial carrier protein n=1 Tax=Paralvinella palmiformis TaxID=53620 RepID=A0AAD9K6G8_9ANNE|nr:hypothetical protein LSH36_52g06000 [Paralvinella palmiformis]
MLENKDQFIPSLVSGSAAGLCTDLSLYPLDTIKTRLQSADGFFKSGGFRGIYAGFGSVAVGSMPGAALFFVTYEKVKSFTRTVVPPSYLFTTHMAAASFGELMACLVRVPVEVVKQRAMIQHRSSSWSVLLVTVRQEVFITFGNEQGGIAAGITTPLDVAKTRIMLAQSGSHLAQGRINLALHQIYKEKGFAGLFAGILPRTLGIAIGGAIFLGAYDKSQKMYRQIIQISSEPS